MNIFKTITVDNRPSIKAHYENELLTNNMAKNNSVCKASWFIKAKGKLLPDILTG
jgi:hypothetical protein